MFVMSDKIVMGYWDCSQCGAKGIKGTIYDCPSCGCQRGKETRFYMKDGPVEYVEGHKVVGADWYCEYCGALNSASRDTCENCNSSKKESEKDYFSFQENSQRSGSVEKKIDDIKIDHSEYYSGIKNHDVVSLNHSWVDFIQTNFKEMIAVMVVLIAVILGTILAMNSMKPRVFEVMEHQWQSSIDVEDLNTYHESGWSVPEGGRVTETRQEVRSHRRVIDHYESVTKSRQVADGGHYETDYKDNGDGTFTEHSTYVTDYKTEYYTEQEPVYRSEPVYDTKYYYDIDRWKYARTVTSEGTGFTFSYKDPELAPNERELKRTARYFVNGNVRKKNRLSEMTAEVNETDWKELSDGSVINATFSFGWLKSWEFADKTAQIQ